MKSLRGKVKEQIICNGPQTMLAETWSVCVCTEVIIHLKQTYKIFKQFKPLINVNQ